MNTILILSLALSLCCILVSCHEDGSSETGLSGLNGQHLLRTARGSEAKNAGKKNQAGRNKKSKKKDNSKQNNKIKKTIRKQWKKKEQKPEKKHKMKGKKERKLKKGRRPKNVKGNVNKRPSSHGGKPQAPRSGCGRQADNDNCMANILLAMSYEGKQVKNFGQQKTRLTKFNDIVGKKSAKKDDFQNTTTYLSTVNSSCQDSSSSSDATSTLATLNECSTSINTSCTIPEGTVNSTQLDSCETSFDEIKTLVNATTAAGATTAAAATTTAAATTAAGTTAASTTTAGCKCGIKKTSRIIGGAEAEVNEYPWIAVFANKDGTNQGGCASTLVANNWAVSASHCFVNKDTGVQELFVSTMSIVLGIHDRTSITETLRKVVEISEIIMHPDYNHGQSQNDIALLKFKESVDLNTYSPACLPTKNADFTGQNAWVYGWGLTSNGGTLLADKLQELEVPIVSDAVCKTALDGQATITSDMLCAGGVEGKDSCGGDSGGPLTVDVGGKHTLVGDVSFGIGCAQAGLYGVYGDVPYFREWIDTTIAAKDSGAAFCT